MSANNINWEKRRFQAAVQILAAMAANYNFPYIGESNVKDAVRMADKLIECLNDERRKPKCAELYQR